MVEFANSDTAEEYFDLLSDGGNFDGAGYLEYVCSAFFGKTLRCPENVKSNWIVRGYELFCRDSSFVYGVA